MVEGAIAFPIVILTAVLLIRVFTFYLQILDTGICEHLDALEAMDSYGGKTMKVYRDTAHVKMFRGGLLNIDLDKQIDTKAYFINEDTLVRAGGLFG